jgi:hypothetical protein
MRVDRKLNLVLTVDRDEGVAYVHSTPISRDVFETYFEPISVAYAEMVEKGGEWMARQGPRTALLMLKKVAKRDNCWEGTGGVENGLMNEIMRLANIVVPVERGGWDTVPLADAKRLGLLTDDDMSEVMNAIVFFTVCLSSMRRADAEILLTMTAGLFGAQITSSNVTEWAVSLETSTMEESIGAREIRSSMPS